MRDFVILGAGGLAQQVAWCAGRCAATRVVAMVDELIPAPSEWQGIPVIPSLGELPKDLSGPSLLSAVGSAELRRRWAEEHGQKFGFATLIDPSSIVAPGTPVGEGSILLPGTICSTNVSVGTHTILGFNVSLSHDTSVGSFSHLAGGVILNGRSRVGDDCRIGAGAIVLPDIEIGDGAVVGAGAMVTKNVQPGTRVAGVPARLLRSPGA